LIPIYQPFPPFRVEKCGGGEGQGENNMTEHTPGPWIICGDNKDLIGADDGKMMIVQLLTYHVVPEWERSKKENLANARLIAAAPELLDALRSLVNCPDYANTRTHEMTAARLAISKAEGEN
jgi:hypothetical protein